MKALIIFLFVVISNLSMASLFSNDKVFSLAEELSSARYDYDHGIEISFQEKLKLNELLPNLNNRPQALCLSFSKSSSEEILEVLEVAVEKHLQAYSDEEFDFFEAVNEAEKELQSYKEIVKCVDEAGFSKYFDENSGEFILSYKFL